MTDRLENEHLGNMDQYRATREVPLPYALNDRNADDDDGDGEDEDRQLKVKRQLLETSGNPMFVYLVLRENCNILDSINTSEEYTTDSMGF